MFLNSCDSDCRSARFSGAASESPLCPRDRPVQGGRHPFTGSVIMTAGLGTPAPAGRWGTLVTVLSFQSLKAHQLLGRGLHGPR